MGWTSLKKSDVGKPKEFFKREFTGETYAMRHEVQDYATKGSTAYIALKVTPKPGYSQGEGYEKNPDGSFVMGLVVLTQRRPRDVFNFSYKDMDESMGPCESQCPARILKQLSPLKDKDSFAAKWRARCETNLPRHTPAAGLSFESD